MIFNPDNMKSLSNSLFALMVMLLFSQEIMAQYPKWDDPNSLPIWMTPEEETRKHEIGKNFPKSAALAGEFRNVAEFERMEGVLVRYPLGLPTSLIADWSRITVVYTLVSNAANENSARSAYQSAGANMNNCQFIRAATDSYWTRDYGPWFVVNEDNQVGIVDFPYNRPRPNDDAVNGIVADYFDVPLYNMPVIHCGGNYMTDGWGISASTDLVYEENSNNQTWVNQQIHDYLGIDTYHVTIDPLNAYIKHIDCWGKFLDVDKVLITSVPASNSNYSKYEQVASYYATKTSAYGTPFQVFRVYSPSGQPYTNSVVINDRVYVPVMSSIPSSTDNAALEVYRQAMPGYTVKGIYYSSWESTDALHCRVMGLADRNMLYIKHLPIAGEKDYQSGYAITADIVPLSGQTLKSDSLFVIFKTNARDWDTINFVNVSGDTYNAVIPVNAGETMVSYYLFAADNSGRRECHPFIGKPDPHTFTIEYNGDLSVNPAAVPARICSGNSTQLYANATGGSGTYSYSWNSDPAGFTSLLANPAVSPSVTTRYTVVVNDGTNTISGNVTVTVDPLPTAVISGSATICAGSSANLSVALTGTAPWSITYTEGTTPLTISGISGTPATISVSPTSTKTYRLTAVSDSRCTGTSYTGSALVTVNPLPTAVISGSATICAGSSANLSVALTGTPPWSITYTDGTTPLTISGITGTPATISVSPTSTKTYRLTAVSDSRCTGTSYTGSALVTVNPLPTVYAGADRSIPYCTSTAINDATASGVAPLSYSWTPAISFVNASLLNPVTRNLTASDTYTLTVTDGNSCTNSDQMTITVTGSPLAVNPVASSLTICSGSPVQLNANATGGSGTYSYSWTSEPAGFTSGIANPIANPATTTTYTVHVNDGFNTVSGNVTVTVNPLPTAVISGSSTICAGSSANLSVALTGTPPWSITYTDGTTPLTISGITGTPATISVSPTSTKTYRLTAVSDSRCTGTSYTGSALVTVNPLPTVYAGADRNIPYGTSTTINDATASGVAPLSYSWTPATSFVNASLLNPVTRNLTASDTFTLTVTDGNLCTNSDRMTVTVVNKCITLTAKVLLEGSMVNPDNSSAYTYPMRTTLNQMLMLPGQSYKDLSGKVVYTPAGQPFNAAPWNYSGDEGAEYDSGGNTDEGSAGYPANAVDWVLVSLRAYSGNTFQTVCQRAALLLSDGTIQMVTGFECCDLDMNGSYYLVVEHRNHLIVMSDKALPVVNGSLTYDFTVRQSYIDPGGLGSVGQKQISGRYVMYGGNGNQSATPFSATDINSDDQSTWESQNGRLGYRTGDYNLNGDTNSNDQIIWQWNNGCFTSVILNY